MVAKMSSCTSLFLLCLAFISIAITASEVSHDGRAITIEGKRRILISGSIHYPRSTVEMWPSLIKKSKEGGLNVIETYVFWNAHEPQRRQYDFSGNLDLVKFIRTIQNEGLYAFLRIGPYVCAEWNYGGFPVWLHNIPNIEFRTKNQVYMDEMKTFTTYIVDLMKREKLFASQGGPIIVAQIENEYGDVIKSYGDAGKEYVKWCAQLADSYQIGVPWVMCKQDDAPQPMINTCNGYYCDQFHPNNPKSPKIWTENWSGWYKSWGRQDPHRTAEDLAFAVARFYQYGGTLQNYYMYHGGTNFGRTAGGPYITTSYDYDAPLDEYGNLNQPKWGHLKQLHDLLISMETILTYGTPNNTEFGNMVTATIYNHEGKSACFLGNANASNDATINFQNTNYNIPAWSVSILPDCKVEVYNTAKVNSQTSVMMKKDEDGELLPLKWEWLAEPYVQTSVALVTKELLDQKVVTNDTSDYLWYITFVDVSDPMWLQDARIRVNTSGHILHVFANGKHIGSQYADNGHYQFVYESKINLKPGRNEMALLSVTVGLANYGAFFDKVDVGIHGPVELLGVKGNDQVILDLSKNEWIYKVGLKGEQDRLFSLEKAQRPWFSLGLPTNRIFVWYKTVFKAPSGNEPVVVDLMGLGKGHAWVNGNSIGRYFTSYPADETKCTGSCDYRGQYSDSKCLTNCGKPSQRWYHIPRSFLRDGLNTLVLFEEKGGDPSSVKFQTVRIGKVCGNAYEKTTLELACSEDQVISQINFASFGQPKGTCGSFGKGSCESPQALSVIKGLCLGKNKCAVDVNEEKLGAAGCKGETRLAIEAICEKK